MVETFLSLYCGCDNTNGWIVTFEKASKDKKEYMSNSSRNVISFDKVSERHNKLHRYGERLASNDALYVTEQGDCYFIEFKNGALTHSRNDQQRDEGKEENLKTKVYCSLAIALDLKLADNFEAFKNKFRYILVYNKDRLGSFSNAVIEDDLQILSKANLQLPVVREFEWIFKESLSYTKEEFEEKFINTIVEPEYLAASS